MSPYNIISSPSQVAKLNNFLENKNIYTIVYRPAMYFTMKQVV